MASNNQESYQLMVKFFTKNEKYSIADNPYSIDSASNAEALNSLLKSILREDNAQIDKNDLDALEFDFYVNGTFLDDTIASLIKSQSEIKVESLIQIEYTERNPPPEPLDTIITDDWVSSIRALDDLILVGSYDNTVQLWNTKGERLSTFNAHSSPIKAVGWISADENRLSFLSTSHDQSILIWHVNKKQANKVEKLIKCVGHAESVECVDLNNERTKFLSGSWDKMLKLWTMLDELPGDESISKKKKSDPSSGTKTPIITLSGHTENISSCKWIDAKTACTASWDHSIKLWDVFVGQETQTLKSLSKIFLSIDYSSLNGLICAGLNDSIVRVYDPRSNEGNLIKISLASHTGWVSAVNWSKTNANLLVSGSYDGLGKLWDIRNTKSALYDLVGHDEKIMCVDWSMSDLILTGSSDNTFKMYRI